jgi:hypothetical protein
MIKGSREKISGENSQNLFIVFSLNLFIVIEVENIPKLCPYCRNNIKWEDDSPFSFIVGRGYREVECSCGFEFTMIYSTIRSDISDICDCGGRTYPVNFTNELSHSISVERECTKCRSSLNIEWKLDKIKIREEDIPIVLTTEI